MSPASRPPDVPADPERRARWAWDGPAWRSATGAFLTTRLAVLFVGYMAVSMLGFPLGPPFRTSNDAFWNLGARWDAGWYLGIAAEGYSSSSQTDRQQNIAFFPAYPLMMRAAGRLLGAGPRTSDQAAEAVRHDRMLRGGLLVALLAFWAGLVYLYRQARADVGEARAPAALFLIASYPFAVFYGAPYTESLFLLTTVAAFYHFQRRELAAAAIWGLVAGLTRPNGCFLSIPLGLMSLTPLWPRLGHRWAGLERHDGGQGPPAAGRWGQVGTLLAVAAMPGVGMLLYSAYLFATTGDAFRWAAVHGAWGREYRGVWVVFQERYEYIAYYGPYGYLMDLPVDALNGAASLAAILAIVPVTWRFGLPYGIFVAVSVLPPLAAGGTLSLGRVTSVVFPLFIWLAGALRERGLPAWVVGFGVLQGLAAALFFTWRPLY